MIDQLDQLTLLVSRFGFRVSNLDARRAGVPERVLFDAATSGRALLERTHLLGGADSEGFGGGHVSVYLIFA